MTKEVEEKKYKYKITKKQGLILLSVFLLISLLALKKYKGKHKIEESEIIEHHKSKNIYESKGAPCCPFV